MFTIQESGAEQHVDLPEVSYFGDNIVLLEMKLGDDLERTIRIVKSRGSAHDGRRHPLVIRRGGIVVV
jgi:KaiC/GvpD/RAD55 family RecA-like ATPase